MRALVSLGFVLALGCSCARGGDKFAFLGGLVHSPQVINTAPKPPVICAFIEGWGVEYFTAAKKNCMCVIQGMVVPVDDMLMVPVLVAHDKACIAEELIDDKAAALE